MTRFQRQAAIIVLSSLGVSCSSQDSNPGGPALPPSSPKVGSETNAASPSRPAAAHAEPVGSSTGVFSNLDKIYRDESHCLTAADMRGDRDMPISCWCRDAIVDLRYVYRTYLLPGKDPSLNGTLLTLEQHAREQRGTTYDPVQVERRENWTWSGPEIVRTYPADEVIARIKPETRDGRVSGRWVPFTVQLVYRDEQGRVSRTENYSSREFEPIVK